MQTLIDSVGSDRPQRRTAFVGRELWRYSIQIAETWFADVGQDSRHRGLEDNRTAKHAYSLKADKTKMDWSCYKSKSRKRSGNGTIRKKFLLLKSRWEKID